MTRRFLPLCVACLALALTSAAPPPPEQVADVLIIPPMPDRCDGIEFDAITSDPQGKEMFFKDGFLWRGFRGPAQCFTESSSEPGRVGAAFRMHREGNAEDHDHVYLFHDEMVFRYFNQTLQQGYPKKVVQEFPGVPSHLDAAVECPKGECSADSVLFFKGSEVYHYDVATRTVKTRAWPQVPACTSALRWMEHYYCFQGNNFTRFHPVTGVVVVGAYPKDAREYFMSCPDFGHGFGGNHELPECFEVRFDAVTSDNAGKTYHFTGSQYVRLDTSSRGKMHDFPISHTWPEVAGGVDAVFSYQDKMYFIRGDQVWIYRSGAHYSLIEGYPKSLQEELGVQGPVDAAFTCPGDHTAHIIQGDQMTDVDLSATPRTVTVTIIQGDQMTDVDLSATPRTVTVTKLPSTLDTVDAALCGPDGMKLFQGNRYVKYRHVGHLKPMKSMPGVDYLVVDPEVYRITSSMTLCSFIQHSNPF